MREHTRGIQSSRGLQGSSVRARVVAVGRSVCAVLGCVVYVGATMIAFLDLRFPDFGASLNHHRENHR